MEKDEKKKKIILAIVGILVLIVGIVGLTYAYFIARGQSEDITVTSKNLKIVFEDNTPVINATDIEPIEEKDILTNATKKTFSISKESASGKDLYVRLDMTDLVISDNFKDFDFKWALYQGTNKITTGTFVPTLDGSTSINMATNILLNSTTPIEYNLYIWINETGLDQSNLMDGRLTGKITAVGEANQLNTLASNILGDNNSNVITSSPVFDKTSTDKGLYVEKDDNEKSEFGFPTYYYRGLVENNYVQMGTYKSEIKNLIWYPVVGEGYMDVEERLVASVNDPIIWRVVRINEDGSIKLVAEYSQEIIEVFNSTKHAKYINDDGTDSEAKTSVDNWYKAHITENNLKDKVQTGSFCNDITGGLKFEPNIKNSGNSFTRMFNTTPIFKCLNGSIVATEKAGLLTADELIYSGSSYVNKTNPNISYLNNHTNFLTMTPQQSDGILGGYIDNNYEDERFKISSFWLRSNAFDGSPRTVINLKSDVIINSGTGSETDPYIIQ